MSIALFLTGLGQAVIYVILGTGFIWLAKRIDDWRTKGFNDDTHIDDGNLAVGLRRSGLYLGIAIALTGAMTGSSNGFWFDIVQLAVDGVFITGFMFLTRFINDAIMLGHIDNDAECVRQFAQPDGTVRTGNTAVGMVEAGMYLATGFILHGSFSGGGGTFVQGILSAVLFFVIGQAILLILGLFYEMTTPFNVRNEIKADNPAAGIGLAGILIALGIILMASLSGPFTGWKNDLAGFFIYAVFGMVMLLIFQRIIDRLLLPTTSTAVEVSEDRNTAALLVTESALIALAAIIASAM